MTETMSNEQCATGNDSGTPAGLRNRVLAALPEAEYARLEPHLRRRVVASGEVLADAERPLDHAFFPETGVLSVLRRMQDGRCIEAYPVGSDAMLGIPELLAAVDASTRTARGAVTSECSSVSLATLRTLLPELPRLAELLPRMAVVLLEQSQQVLACNGLHSVEHRCARWLLTTHDRVGDEFEQTHDALAQLLAVRRASVTVSMAAFQKARLIASRRGRIRIEDRAGLEMAACACYTAVRASSLHPYPWGAAPGHMEA